MSRISFGKLSVSLLVALLALPAMALNVVNTSAPQINCLFTTSSPCTITVTDYSSTFMSGAARLQSRIFQGQPGSTAAGKYVYEYRVDLTQVAGITYPPSVDEVAIYSFSPLRQYDYNFDSIATDDVFNVTVGGIGTKPVTSSFFGSGYLWFVFNNPVFAGSYPGGGESSYFFGVVSDYPPTLKTVWVHTDTGWVAVTGYAPQYP